MVKITCETVGCGKIIAEGVDYEDAKEIGIYENDADYCSEAGVWTCAQCYIDYMDQGMLEAMGYQRELDLRDLYAREDDYLAALDLAYDTMREGDR